MELLSNHIDYTEYFANPGKEFRGLPFWAWNTEITEEKVTKQVEVFKQMGYGGFVIHVRHGLRTEYMGKEFMERVSQAIDEAKKNDLIVWLYDEDRWPSGCTGGIVTKERQYRQKTLLITQNKIDECVSRVEGIQEGKTWLLAAYNVELNAEHELTKCEVTNKDNANYFAYVMTAEGSPRYNGQSYVDVLNDEAIQKFIETTYDVYYEKDGDEFGKQIEAIFTDEPQFAILPTPSFSSHDNFVDVVIPWTNDLPETYKECFGEDIISVLPELIWNRSDGKLSAVRYRYNEHLAERFRKAYCQPIGRWCEAHNISLTGHFMLEGSLFEQLKGTRDVMRCYPDFQIPGIDNLCGRYEFNTAKQCQSVAHQIGVNRVMSELYGVTNWTADFRDYIHQGNWQAALGVTVRVPHLTWMTMKGVGKRDYPATFGYQAPWYKKYHLVEDHFARLNTVLSSGKPIVKVGVIHPVESYWFYFGANDKNAELAAARDKAFDELCEWLIFGGIDFDYINEALILESYNNDTAAIGKMRYDAVIVPACITLRDSTLKALESMKKHGVRIIFAGDIPTHLNGIESSDIATFADVCENISMTKESIRKNLREYRSYEFIASNGTKVSDYISQMREICGKKWLYLTPARNVIDKENTHLSKTVLKLNGHYIPKLYDTMSGKISVPSYQYDGQYTLITLNKYGFGSFLLALDEGNEQFADTLITEKVRTEVKIANKVSYARDEKNVCLLDIAEYSLNGISYSSEDEIFQIDSALRKELKLPSITGKSSFQPWIIKNDTEYTVWLRYGFESDIATECKLAYESLESLAFNGKNIDIISDGTFVDDDINTVTLPVTKIGHNEIIVSMKMGKTRGIEPMYVIGDFDVKLAGTEKTLIKSNDKIGFGNSTVQGLPFYGGNLTYTTEIETPDCDLEIAVTAYRGDLVTVCLDGEEKGDIILPPYRLIIKGVKCGKHAVSFKCYGNRNNTFGSLHSAVNDAYHGPNHWYKFGDDFSSEYDLCENGILRTPTITILE